MCASTAFGDLAGERLRQLHLLDRWRRYVDKSAVQNIWCGYLSSVEWAAAAQGTNQRANKGSFGILQEIWGRLGCTLEILSPSVSTPLVNRTGQICAEIAPLNGPEGRRPGDMQILAHTLIGRSKATPGLLVPSSRSSGDRTLSSVFSAGSPKRIFVRGCFEK